MASSFKGLTALSVKVLTAKRVPAREAFARGKAEGAGALAVALPTIAAVAVELALVANLVAVEGPVISLYGGKHLRWEIR
jgi:hypothetical protein